MTRKSINLQVPSRIQDCPGDSFPANRSKIHESGKILTVSSLVLIVVFTLLLASCASSPVPVPPDATAAEVIQKAQESLDRNNFKAARYYYQTALDRYASDTTVSIACRYELAFIDYKEGKYREARKGFTDLLALYIQPGGEALPPAYRILATKVLAALPVEKPVKK